MSSPNPDASSLIGFLDPVFGLLVWAGHLLVVYVGTTIGCLYGISSGQVGIALGLVTVASTFLVTLHAVRRARRARETAEQRFRTSFTFGCDAIAAVAVGWQLFAIVLVPACL